MAEPKYSSYDASSIQVLEGLEPVRKRPAMYIGDTGVYGYHHLLTEIVNNSVDEALSGYADTIWVILHPNNAVTVIDNGRGMPFDEHPQYKKSALEITMTILHSGGKFSGEGYKVSGGLHGVGVSVVNAVSERTRVEIKRGNVVVSQEFSRGGVHKEFEKTKAKSDQLETPEYSKIWEYKLQNWKAESGTAFTFVPDEEIFPSVKEFDYDRIKRQLRDYAFLTGGVKFHLIDERDVTKPVRAYQFYFEGGIQSFVKYLNRQNHPIMATPFYANKDVVLNEQTGETAQIEIAMQYHDEYTFDILSFVNNIHTPEGGTHEAGFKTALTRVVNDYSRKEGLIGEKSDNLTGDDIREGLTAIVSVKMNSKNLQFEGQTKQKLGNPEVRSAVETVLSTALSTYLAENPADAKTIIQKANLAQQARNAAKKARETVLRKSALASASLPGVLADCREKEPHKAEIFVVEGISAGGSAKQARDSQFQAVLPLSGKPINTEKNRLDRVLANEKLRDMLVALGCGVGEEIDLENLRYHRIILMADADVDGEHITTLILTFLFRQLRGLIEHGYVYLAQPPLFTVKAGKEHAHVFTEQERDLVVDQYVAKGFKRDNINIQRFKGLGEMNAEQLWETTMNPENRILKKVSIDDAMSADQTFSMLMGDDVLPRKRFIQTHARMANLDV
ncbi:type IIA DNA topoisomerase subunit B [candidate division WWE3 bacterium]|nr:type IIA DNA topoisomerase subunit B [candidate division WWE3 bacterium]